MTALQRARAVFLSLVIDRALDVGNRYLDALEAALDARPVVTPIGNLHDLLWEVEGDYSKPGPKTPN